MGSYYVRNYLSEVVQIILVQSEHRPPLDEKALVFQYGNHVHKLKFNTFRQFNKELKAQKLDSFRVKVTLPPHSTIWLGMGLNAHSWNFSQARLIYAGQEKSIDINNPAEITIKMSGIGHFIGYYDIK